MYLPSTARWTTVRDGYAGNYAGFSESHVQLNPMVESPCKACFATRAAPDV